MQLTEIGCYMKSTLNRLASFRKSGHLNDNNFEIQYYSVRLWSYSIHIWRKSGENMVLWLFFIKSVTIFQYVFYVSCTEQLDDFWEMRF